MSNFFILCTNSGSESLTIFSSSSTKSLILRVILQHKFLLSGCINNSNTCGYLWRNEPMPTFRPTMFLHRDISCTETKGPRFRWDISWWISRMVLSLWMCLMSLSSFKSLVLVSKRVWAEITGFFHLLCENELNGPNNILLCLKQLTRIMLCTQKASPLRKQTSSSKNFFKANYASLTCRIKCKYSIEEKKNF